MRYTVTHYEMTATYHPAEGGIYMEGRQATEWVSGIRTTRIAKEIFRKMVRDYGYTTILPNEYAASPDRLHSRYIGDGCIITVERGNGPSNHYPIYE